MIIILRFRRLWQPYNFIIIVTQIVLDDVGLVMIDVKRLEPLDVATDHYHFGFEVQDTVHISGMIGCISRLAGLSCSKNKIRGEHPRLQGESEMTHEKPVRPPDP